MLFALEVRLQLIVERAMECSHSKVSGHGRAGYSHFNAASAFEVLLRGGGILYF